MSKTADPVAELQALQATLQKEKAKIAKARAKAKKLIEEEEETLQLCEELEEEEMQMSTAIKAKLAEAKKAVAGGMKSDPKLAPKVKAWAGKVGRLKG